MTPHEVLGVRPGAGRAEVVAAFRRFALRHHPDRGGDPTRFQAGLDAYHRLTGGTTWRGAAAGTSRAPAEVVFHRRRRRSLDGLVRRARRRLAAVRP